MGNLKISKKAVYKGITYIILTLGLIIVVLPMIYMLSTALKPNGALYEYPPRFFPKIKEITLENFQYILHQKKFGNNFINSIFVSTVTVAIAAIVAAAMAFCIARFKFPGRKFLFTFIMQTMIIPGTTLIVPQYELAVKLKVINKLSGLIPFYSDKDSQRCINSSKRASFSARFLESFCNFATSLPFA